MLQIDIKTKQSYNIKNYINKKEGLNIMKKLLAMLLVAVMSFSLVACGGEAESKNDSVQQETTQNETSNAETEENKVEKIPKEVEITVDNWQEYFEIVEVPVWVFNDFDEIEGCYGIITSLCLKEEFVEKGVSEKTNLAFEYTATRHVVPFEADLENKEVTLGEPYETQSEEVTKTTSYKAASTMSDSDKAIYEYTAEYPVIAHLLFSATGSATYQLENVSFTRIEGTLVFEK